MTKHYAENQRKGNPSAATLAKRIDAVTSLHTHLPQNLIGTANSTSLSPLVAHLAPLILDTSSSVRSVLLELLGDLSPQIVPKEALQAHLPMLLLYIQSAMTHIQADIRSDSTKFLAWTLDIGPEEVVRGSWTKLLSSYSALLSWSMDSREKMTVKLARGGTSVVGNINVTARHVEILYKLLDAGLSTTSSPTKEARAKTYGFESVKSITLQHPLIQCYLMPTYSSPFASLNLFSSGQVDLQTSSHDIPSRRAQFEQVLSPLLSYLHDLTAELGPSGPSRQPNQSVIDDLSVSIIRIMAIIHHVYQSEEPEKQHSHKQWKRCTSKMSNLIESRSQSDGSRRLTREWELGNLFNV
jgi:Rix1 complex component involved in 60S ribosome maturation